MTVTFHPQPYPLYAVTIEKAPDPARFQLADDPIRLVIGWQSDEHANVTPVLAGGSPGGTVWHGPAFFEETRDRAEETASEVAKADRGSIRTVRIAEAFAWLDREQPRA